MKLMDIRIVLKSGTPIEIFGAKMVMDGGVESEIKDAKQRIARQEMLEYTTYEEMAVLIVPKDVAMISIVEVVEGNG